jgi:hypothetical protein
MTECSDAIAYPFYDLRQLEVKFSGLDLSSDAGVLLARQAEAQIGICRQMAAVITDPRAPERIRHSQQQLLSQRIYQILAGYEDANDSNELRHDPMFKIACERLPIAGAEALASQPTISRLENQVSEQDIKALRRLFVDHFIASYQQPPRRLVLDIDGWDDPTHGEQQLSLFHGYFGQSMYFPMLINEADSGYPLVLQLRPGNSHPGKGVAGILRWLFWRLKRAWPEVGIILRADAGFALPELIRLCERSGVGYVIGFARNAVLERKIADLLERARRQFIRTQETARLFDDVYYAAQSWSQPRRLVMKAEWLAKGANPRFLLTNLETPPQALYDHLYVQRGADSEHRIKELKLGLQADRLSCHRFCANQFRLFLTQAAYLLMLTLRRAATGTALASAQVERLRTTLIKQAAKVTLSVRRVLVEMSAHCPWADTIRQITHRLCSPDIALLG